MKDVYIRTFKNLVREKEQVTGFTMPPTVESYCVFMLAERVEKTQLIPDPSFAERYLLIYQEPRAEDFRQFADDCLFFTSLLPEYGARRGLSMKYYADLGISSYSTCASLSNDLLFAQMARFFFEIQKFLNSTIRNRPFEGLSL